MVCTPGTRHRRTGRRERRPAGLPSCTGRLHASGTVHVLRAGPPIAVLIGPVPRRPGESCDAAARVICSDRMGQTGPTSHSVRAASHIHRSRVQTRLLRPRARGHATRRWACALCRRQLRTARRHTPTGRHAYRASVLRSSRYLHAPPRRLC